ncbi:MAG: peptidyl-prolyl cis-trans isomerase [Pseudomonadota bacterium]
MRSLKLFSSFLTLMFFSHLAYTAPAQPANEAAVRGPLLSTVNGENIHVRDLQAYAKSNPLMSGYMTHLAGVRRVLDDLINVKLLVLEGQRRAIPRNEDETDSRYAWRMRNQLTEPCERLDEAGSKAFYEAHPELFSTPAYVRVNKVYLKSGDSVDGLSAADFLKNQAAGLRDGSMKFDDLVTKVRPKIPSDIRLGDMGFIPMNEKDALIDQLNNAKVDDLVGPFEKDGFIYLFQVTERREPVTLKWEEVLASAQDAAYSHCMQTHYARLRKDMESHFPVVMHEENIASLKFN